MLCTGMIVVVGHGDPFVAGHAAELRIGDLPSYNVIEQVAISIEEEL
jgi:hypothetical protein